MRTSRAVAWSATVVLGGLLALAPGASARTLIGTGGEVRSVASDDGTVHLVYRSRSGTDELVRYCRVAPGTETCAQSTTFDLNDAGRLEADVVRDPGTGKVHVLLDVIYFGGQTRAPGYPTNGLYDLISTQPDAAGATFATPKRVAPNNENSWEGAVHGPGAFEVSSLSAISGLKLAIGTTDGSGSATLDMNTGSQLPGVLYDSDVVLGEGRVPLVGGHGDGGYRWRAHKGDGSTVRDIANWRPGKLLPGSFDGTAHLAGNGIAPPVLVYREQVGGTDWRAVVRRYDAAGDAFGAPTTLNDDDNTLRLRPFLDGASNVHALFTSNSPAYRGSATTALVYTASATGETWPRTGIVLDTDTSTDDPTFAAGTDGRGLAAWSRPAGNGSSVDDEVYATRLGGPGVGFPADPPPAATPGPGATPTPVPADPACVKTVTLGVAKVLSSGCFKAGSGATLTTTQPFLLNGLTVDPKGVAVTVDSGKRTLKTAAATTVRLGTITLAKGAVTWTFPASGTFTFPAPFDLDKAGYGASLLGLKVTGDATLSLTDGKSVLKAYLQLPVPFSDTSAAVDFRGDNQAGLHLDQLDAKVGPSVTMGLGFKNMTLSYTSDPPTWTGHVEWKPPVPGLDAIGAFDGDVTIVDGAISRIHVGVQFPTPGRILYPPLVYLRYGGFELQLKPDLAFTGEVIAGAGPVVGEYQTVMIGRPFDDKGTVRLSLGSPLTVAAKGPVYVLGFKLGQGYFTYTYPGDVAFGANAKIGDCSVAGAQVSFDGYVHVAKDFAFNAAGAGSACVGGTDILQAEAVVSSKGIAACGSVGVEPFVISGGAGHFWGSDDVESMWGFCDVQAYKVGPPPGSSLRQADGTQRFVVTSGLRQLNVVATGATGVPAFTLTGPDGRTVTTPATGGSRGEGFLTAGDPRARTQGVSLARPAAGTWTLTPSAGSPAVAKLETFRDAPAVRVGGSVRRARRGRTLRYAVRPIPGQVVTFYESGDGVLHRIGTAKGATGTLRFTPVAGRGGTRTVTAIVEQGGLPRDRVTLGRFTVPRPARPATPRRLRASRTAATLTVRWSPGARARRQTVRVALSDGRRLVYDRGPRVRTLRIGGLRAAVTGRVSVQGVRADGAPGRRASTTVRAYRRPGKPRR
ncbi:hypothetical protein [Paraconexibacter algicola]|uniref:Fibronectin type-III domain-containing protein n=1 Tax=Paraconexibacter algicola TaxID=2133960 RepID=A0A2T4UJE0_9ACTN|nr:hypothetical protein [Paraconexibacter algicola]PTL59356.1 hypothetical protein C7Y72_06660 [Paraconexibacter algicola]